MFGPCGDQPSLPESSAGVRVQLENCRPTETRHRLEELHVKNSITKRLKLVLDSDRGAARESSLVCFMQMCLFFSCTPFSFFLINHNSCAAESHEA